MSTRSLFGVRLWILIVALVLVAGGTINGLFVAWRRVQHLEAVIDSSRTESFRLADEVERELSQLNNGILRYAVLREDKRWEEFRQASADLNNWIDAHDPSMNPTSVPATDTERRLLQELNLAFDDYLKAAWMVHTNKQPALVSSGQFTQLDTFDTQAERMRDLVRKLADAHHKAEKDFLANADTALSNLRAFLTAGVVLLLTLVAAMGWVIYRDMIAPLRTRLVHSQILLERQEKLATLGTLAAGIAHEIRNPLTSLKARLYTLEKHLQVVPAARKDTDIIGTEISRLERIVQDVLSFARPADPKLEVIPVAAVLREVEGLMSPSLESRGVHLVLEATPELFVRADSGHLKQVLINLVRNATEAIEGAGTVTLEAKADHVPINGRQSEVVILEVSDTGKGISPEAQQRLFDPFFSTKETGTGLGLSIAARIVERHGGLLQYQTQPGRGTTFGVVLPREIGESSSDAARPSHSAH